MKDDSPGGPLRLRGAGIGTVVGGITLGLLSVIFPYAPAAAGTVVVGLLLLLLGRRRRVPTGLWVGCVAVGGIGLFEALGFGLGLGPLLLAAIAVGAGVIDVVVGGALERFRSRS